MYVVDLGYLNFNHFDWYFDSFSSLSRYSCITHDKRMASFRSYLWSFSFFHLPRNEFLNILLAKEYFSVKCSWIIRFLVYNLTWCHVEKNLWIITNPSLYSWSKVHILESTNLSEEDICSTMLFRNTSNYCWGPIKSNFVHTKIKWTVHADLLICTIKTIYN